MPSAVNVMLKLSNVLRKLIIFGNAMQHLIPRGDFPFDVEEGGGGGGFAAVKAVTSRGPIDEYSFFKSENDKPELASFLAKLFLMIE